MHPGLRMINHPEATVYNILRAKALWSYTGGRVISGFSAIIPRMQKLARLFLLCLMMIAIPVQGIAASTMLYCGAEHHQAMESDHRLVKHSVGEQTHATHGDNASATDSCSSCADCCVGCAPALTSSHVPVFNPSSEKINSIFSSHAGHIGDGPERPPRA